MTREIKYKFWDKTHKLMSQPVVLFDHFPFSVDLEFVGRPEHKIGEVEFTREELEPLQYTGLKDKNGVEIYEGDVVAYTDELDARNLEVYWDSALCGFQCRLRGYHTPIMEEQSEVIGNVWENPELINRKDGDDTSNN